jgi:hypothetical protein
MIDTWWGRGRDRGWAAFQPKSVSCPLAWGGVGVGGTRLGWKSDLRIQNRPALLSSRAILASVVDGNQALGRSLVIVPWNLGNQAGREKPVCSRTFCLLILHLIDYQN